MAISDLAVIDRLTTRARREGSNLFVEVLDGPEVLKSTQYTNGSSITPSEIPALLQDALLSVISGDRGTGGSFVTVSGTVAVGNTLTATLAPNVTATSFQWKRDGVAINGAVNSTYIVQDIDAGKAITVSAIGISVGADGGTPPAITDPRPGFAQASPLGFASGGRRSLATQHNSYSMYLAQCDGDGAEIALTNTSIFASAGAAEAVSTSPLTFRGWAYFPTATWASRTVDVSATGGRIPAGATGFTFTGAAAIETALYLVRFSTGELRWVTLTAGQNTVTWRAAAPLQQAATASIQWKQRGATGWTRVPLVFGGGSSTVDFAANVKKVVKVNVAGSVVKGVPFMVSLNVVPTDGVYPFQLPAQQNPNGEDYNFVGLQEAFDDTGSDVSGTFWGGVPWLAAGYGNGSVRPLSVKVINPRNAVARPVTILGDSISSSLSSWVQRWFTWKGIPYVLLSKAGETPGGAVAQSEVRSQVYDKGLVVCQLGRNSYSLAQLQNLWAYCRAQGFSKIIQVLPPPKTTSGTNNWTTTDSQDADTNTRAVNTQVLAAVGTPTGPHGVIDTFTPCVATKTGGGDVWIPEFTRDGTHPVDASTAAIIAALNADPANFALFDING